MTKKFLGIVLENKKANFGFTEVDYDKKQGMVHGVFESVASKYDIMNDFMSFGLHRLWKKHMLQLIPVSEGSQLLDLAAGSGDISFAFMNKATAKGKHAKCFITDINEHMLGVAKDRIVDENIKGEFEFHIVNAENIPFPDNSFDFCTIAFGIRNVTDIPKALAEIKRVLKPGGKFICLEFSNVENEIIKRIYDEYSFKVIPKVGKLVAGDDASYQYLVESIRKFPDAETFKEMMEQAGLENVAYEKLTHGVVAIHTGWKI